MAKVILDFGNAWLKVYEPKSGKKIRIPHYIATMQTAAWEQVSVNGKPAHQGYIAIGTNYYAVGERAKRHVIQQRPRGAARYVKSYYGVGMFYALSEMFPDGHSNIELVASYAPGDFMHVKALVDAARGKWSGYTHLGKVTFNVQSVETFDEPFGGWANLLLTKEGTIRESSQYLMTSTTYVLDIGGHTVDGLAVDPNGQIDYSSATSTRSGVLHILQEFENELRTEYREDFQRIGNIDPARLESALATGFYRYGKRDLDLQVAARQLKQKLVNEVVEIFTAAGGVANYDHVVLTGGGAGMLVGMLRDTLPDVNFVLAHKRIDEIQFANALGGYRFFRMLEIVEHGN